MALSGRATSLYSARVSSCADANEVLQQTFRNQDPLGMIPCTRAVVFARRKAYYSPFLWQGGRPTLRILSALPLPSFVAPPVGDTAINMIDSSSYFRHFPDGVRLPFLPESLGMQEQVY